MTEQFERLKSALAERYAIEREIGSGGMATVYLAEDRKEAIKMYGEIGMPAHVALAEELMAQT